MYLAYLSSVFSSFLRWDSVDAAGYCSLIILNMLVFVDSVIFILFLSLLCLESCFSATFREILLPSSGKVYFL